MDTIFKYLGYQLSKASFNQKEGVLKVLQINNPDGSPRWIWNASNKKPIFLKFYNIGSARAKIFALAIKLVFLLKLQRFVFKGNSYFIIHLTEALFDYKKEWAIFTGTVGPNNKAIVYDGTYFIKVATTENAKNLLINEKKVLTYLKNSNVSFVFPQILKYNDHSLMMSDVSIGGKRITSLNESPLEALLSMYQLNNKQIKIKDWNYLNDLIIKFKSIDNKKIPKNLIRKVNELINSLEPNEIVDISFSHADFAQWNLFGIENKIAIYDWELANFDMPKGFDFFHFILQNDILMEHLPWKKIQDNIYDLAKGRFYEEMFNQNPEELNKYLKWYLLINCLHYLSVYNAQKDWHIQIEWLLNAWNQGLNTYLSSKWSPRQQIMMDFFDMMQQKEYAVLKLQEISPENIDIQSDIDLVIDKSNHDEIVSFLSSHASVFKFKCLQKSFMSSIQIITHDAEVLSIDLIWQLKRKNIEFLGAKSFIKQAKINEFGIKNATDIQTARFIVLFYTLNHAQIPQKYSKWKALFENSKHEFDTSIQHIVSKPDNKNQYLLRHLKSKTSTWNYFKNTINYFMDTLKQVFSNRGFIITFSGVDGAGKTTVINNIVQRIDKELRMPVVVLRHRPSILPILSVWTKGKEKAHLDTISNLPRQGKNKHFLSSFLRFSYYYLDYFLGQWHIYFKYVLKGYVVVYDRYYFDFINDSKRSNIVLPKKITSAGYSFLLKPKFNFFLYADATTILKRKQELNEATIISLTKDYKQLFESLQKNTQKTTYQAIKNEDLETTLSQIIQTIIKK